MNCLIYSDIICMNLLWWTCWVNEFHVVSPFILIWCDATLYFLRWVNEWLHKKSRKSKRFAFPRITGFIKFWSLESREVGLIGRFNSMCCQNCTVSKRFNFCQTSNLLHSSTAAWSLSKSASVWHRLQRTHLHHIFPPLENSRKASCQKFT